MSSLKELQDLVQEKYGLDPVKLDVNASMRGSGIDSLALVEFMFAVEDRYGISMPERQADIDTLAELAALVDQVRSSQTA